MMMPHGWDHVPDDVEICHDVATNGRFSPHDSCGGWGCTSYQLLTNNHCETAHRRARLYDRYMNVLEIKDQFKNGDDARKTYRFTKTGLYMKLIVRPATDPWVMNPAPNSLKAFGFEFVPMQQNAGIDSPETGDVEKDCQLRMLGLPMRGGWHTTWISGGFPENFQYKADLCDPFKSSTGEYGWGTKILFISNKGCDTKTGTSVSKGEWWQTGCTDANKIGRYQWNKVLDPPQPADKAWMIDKVHGLFQSSSFCFGVKEQNQRFCNKKAMMFRPLWVIGEGTPQLCKDSGNVGDCSA